MSDFELKNEPETPSFEGMSVSVLRDEARKKGLGTGVWRAGASKASLVKALQTGVAPAVGGNGSGDGKSLEDIIRERLGSLSVDPESVRAIAKEVVDEALSTFKSPCVRVDVVLPSGEVKDMGTQHKSFPVLIKLLGLCQHVMMTGPAGSGKSEAAHKAATALGLEFYSVSVCSHTSETKLLGFMNAVGTYVRTPFRDAYEKGGVFCMDETDAGNANVLSVLNSALSNGECAFPDGMVKRHPGFRLVATANTWGKGADREYCGRNQLDAAFLDRFLKLPWDYDLAFELSLSGDAEFCERVQAIRAAAAALKERVIVSPRASIKGGLLVKGGFTVEESLDLVLWNGVPADVRFKIEAVVKDGGAK